MCFVCGNFEEKNLQCSVSICCLAAHVVKHVYLDEHWYIFDMVKLSIHLFEVVVYTFNGISTLFR